MKWNTTETKQMKSKKRFGLFDLIVINLIKSYFSIFTKMIQMVLNIITKHMPNLKTEKRYAQIFENTASAVARYMQTKR